MENLVLKIRLVKSFFTGEYCLKNDKGKRLTCWFNEYDETVVGEFVKLQTNIGNFVYHKNQPNLLYEYYGDDESVYVYKLTEERYYLQIECTENFSLVQLYRSDGSSVTIAALEDVYPIGNDLIAAKEFCGNWGILDKDLNWQVYPVYDEIYEFRNGFVCALIEKDITTDLLSVDENGNMYFINVEGFAADFLTPELIRSSKNRLYGVCNTKGEKILNIEYDDISLCGRHFIVRKKDLYGLADLTGKILYECKYYQILKTEDGFELVTRQIIDTRERITI